MQSTALALTVRTLNYGSQAGQEGAEMDQVQTRYVPGTHQVRTGYGPGTDQVRTRYIPGTYRVQTGYGPGTDLSCG